MKENEKDPAAVALGRKGGQAGKGASQRRSPEHYKKMLEARREKRAKKGVADAPPTGSS